MPRIQISLSAQPQDFFSELVKQTRGRNLGVLFSDSSSTAYRGFAKIPEHDALVRFVKRAKSSSAVVDLVEYVGTVVQDNGEPNVYADISDILTRVVRQVCSKLHIRFVPKLNLLTTNTPSCAVVSIGARYEIWVTEAAPDSVLKKEAL